jgi:hypothetical protein
MFIKSVLLVLYVYAQEKIERVTTQSSILDNWPDMHIVLHKLNVCFQTSCVFNLANFYNILFSNTCSIYGAIWIGLLTFPLLLGIHEYKPIRQWDIYLDWQVQFQSFSVLSLYCKIMKCFHDAMVWDPWQRFSSRSIVVCEIFLLANLWLTP